MQAFRTLWLPFSQPTSATGIGRFLPGLLLAGLLAFLAQEIAAVGWLQAHGISVLTLAIVLGIATGNTLYPYVSASSAKGIAFSKQYLLRAGIVLYGLRLTFADIAHVGVGGVIIDAVVLSSTFAIACWAGVRLFKLDRKTAMLIGAGSSICGAAAVMATEPVVDARCEQVAIAVATVVVFGTVGMFLYPLMFDLAARHFVSVSQSAYGIYAGSTIHEVAQVVAAGRAVSESAANTAVITKMVRVMMLAPFLMALSACLCRGDDSSTKKRIVIPWFAVGFVGVAAFNSFDLLPHAVVATAVSIDTVLLAMAMAALGLTTHVSAIRTAGLKPLGLAAFLFGWLLMGGFLINWVIAKLF
jgi:uncharacterized integral membrane protein (TIGR00698 family)